MKKQVLAGLGLAVALTLGSAAQAAVTYGGNFSGNDCGGQGGFSNCYAGITGTQQGAASGFSPSIYKFNFGGGADVGSFASITGSEFAITFNASANTLGFTYTPGANDPAIHFFTIKQSNGFALFYDLGSPITSFTADLTTYFPGNPGYSHITFFNTGSSTTTPPPTSVPEPASLALFGAGLLGFAAVRRRRQSR